MLGLGAVSAAMFSNFPFLESLAHHKVWLFAGSGLLLAAGLWALYRPGRSCPTDPVLREQCASADKWNKRLLLASSLIWTIGFTAAYFSLPLLNLYDKISGA